MKVIVAGQKSFGAAALSAIMDDGHEVVAAWAPDPEDRLYRACAKEGVRCVVGRMTPDEVRAEEVDLIVGAHSHAFISKQARQATRLGAIGYHPSLLPRHRGRDAVHWTVHMQDPIAGGSVYWMTDNVDGGPLAAQAWCHVVPSWTASDLWREELFPMGIRLLTRVLSELDQGALVEVPQDERCATWEPSLERPPLFRPDLLQLGGVNGYQVLVSEKMLRG